jgi:protein SCO1/2
MRGLPALALLAAASAFGAPAVSFEQRIGSRLPMDAVLTDETGHSATLGSYFQGKPQVIQFVYFRCPELCSIVSGGATDALRQLAATAGQQFGVLSISIDPTDTTPMAAEWERSTVSRYGRTRASAGWRVLTARLPAISALTRAAGFHYAYDEKSRQFAHPSGFIVATPSGEVSKYFLGVDFDAAELASAVSDAARGRTGSSVYDLIFVCFEGDSRGGPHGRAIWAALFAGVILTVACLFGWIGQSLWRELRARGAGSP